MKGHHPAKHFAFRLSRTGTRRRRLARAVRIRVLDVAHWNSALVPSAGRGGRALDPQSTMSSFRSPRPVTVLATALFVAACIALGYWQLGRARAKQALIEGFARGDATIVEVTSRSLDGLARYQAVGARGSYEPRRQVLLDNMPSVDGRPHNHATHGRCLSIGLCPGREPSACLSLHAGGSSVASTAPHPVCGCRLRRAATPPGRGDELPATDELTAVLGERTSSC
jgi:hypothetical protein